MLSVPIAVLEAELKWTFLGEYESCRRISDFERHAQPYRNKNCAAINVNLFGLAL